MLGEARSGSWTWSRCTGSCCCQGLGRSRRVGLAGVARKTVYRWRAENGGIPRVRLASGAFEPVSVPIGASTHHRPAWPRCGGVRAVAAEPVGFQNWRHVV